MVEAAAAFDEDVQSNRNLLFSRFLSNFDHPRSFPGTIAAQLICLPRHVVGHVGYHDAVFEQQRAFQQQGSLTM